MTFEERAGGSERLGHFGEGGSSVAARALSMFSSLMLPPPKRFSVAPVATFVNVPSGGPPVPDRCDLGSLLYGHPNWFMKPARQTEPEGLSARAQTHTRTKKSAADQIRAQ